ncbi:MAG: DnaJ domain-containing protein [Chloroflexaceae bacterium]|nr:DnaJ domain-containing protein [Chloroflexaceae bacterium]NJL34743.1 DnaJ domain-containing protein [Chloroflexaceae bacterium]
MTDHYETLQVHPKADREAIQAAYQRLIERYNPQHLEAAGVADELVAMARQRRDEIERAYAVVGDPPRRAAYDAEQQARAVQEAAARADTADIELTEDDLIDYRMLPPARGQERPKGFNEQPVLTRHEALHHAGRKARPNAPMWLAPALIVGVLTFVVMLTSLLLTNGGRPRYANSETNAPVPAAAAQNNQQPAEPTRTIEQLIADYEGQVVVAQQVVDAVPDNPTAWERLGDALYDSVQVVREQAPESELYQERVPRWLEASDAYAQVLELAPTNHAVRSEMGVTQCFYGGATGEQPYVQQGLQEVRTAADALPADGRVLMNLGICLVSQEQPAADEAVTVWNRILELPAAEIGVTRQAEILIEQYSQ